MLLLASGFAIFLNLDANELMLWDEGTYATNALEMSLHGDYLVKHFNGFPEMWAVNPPLVCYFQVICMKIFGAGELAVRLPSGLAALGVVLLLIRFSLKENLGMDFATYAVLTLITTQGYIALHVTRTGDLDSVLIFFVTGATIYYYKFIEYENKKTKYLLIFSLFVLLGYFSKGIACFMVLPAFLIYTIARNKTFYVLKTKQLYLFIISILFLIALYYYLREKQTPGYIDLVLKSEFGRWYTDSENPAYTKPLSYYISDMYEGDFKYILAVPAIIILLLALPKDHPLKNKSLIWILTSLTFLIVVSVSKTKTEWYEAPVYPMLSVIMAFGLKAIFTFRNYKPFIAFAARASLILTIFSVPYFEVIQNDLKKEELWHDIAFGEALSKYSKISNAPKQFELLITGYNGPAVFYKDLYSDKFGFNITVKNMTGAITMVPGTTYLFTHPDFLDYAKKNLIFDIIMNKNNMKAIKVIGYKYKSF